MTSRKRAGLVLLKDLFSESNPYPPAAAEGLGISPHVDRLLRRDGRLSRPHRGVRVLGEPSDLLTRARAAGLLLPSDGAIGRRTASELMEIDPRLPSERDQQLDVECLVQTGSTPIRHRGIRCYATDLLPAEIDVFEGFSMTTPDRTLADLLRWLAPHMGLAVADRMARRQLVDVDAVETILDRWDGHRHVATARRLLSYVDAKSESYGESWLRLRILDAGFPRPTCQIPIEENGVEIYRLDLGWPDLRIAVEYDGEEFHNSPEQRSHDAERRGDLFERHRWNVVGVGKAYVLGPTMHLELGIAEMLGWWGDRQTDAVAVILKITATASGVERQSLRITRSS